MLLFLAEAQPVVAYAQKRTFSRHHCATIRVNMASGKKSALLSSLADYGDDSEQDSEPDPDTDEQGTVHCVFYLK